MPLLWIVALLSGCAGGEDPKDTADTADTAEPVDDTAAPADHDGDGSPATEDCDDADASRHPGAPELCDGVDANCDGVADDDLRLTSYTDADGDGFGEPGTGVAACDAPGGTAPNDEDCDDAAAAVHPGASETCDAVDQDCDGAVDEDATDAPTWYADADADGFGDPAAGTAACAAPAAAVLDATDCDDADATAFPGATELCDGADDDCDGAVDEDAADVATWYRDADADGYGDGTSDPSYACDAPARHVSDATDCDDGDAARNPGAAELCDGADDDCDGLIDDGAADLLTLYADTDGDGYGDPAVTTTNCVALAGYVTDATDCDDTAPTTFPSAPETCGDGIDQDCTGDDAVCG